MSPDQVQEEGDDWWYREGQGEAGGHQVPRAEVPSFPVFGAAPVLADGGSGAGGGVPRPVDPAELIGNLVMQLVRQTQPQQAVQPAQNLSFAVDPSAGPAVSNERIKDIVIPKLVMPKTSAEAPQTYISWYTQFELVVEAACSYAPRYLQSISEDLDDQ
jgi:hypothetical protein